MTVTLLDLPIFLDTAEDAIFIAPVVKRREWRVFLDPVYSSGGGDLCEDDRPETGMLYPRG